jgi:hypothetical protein
LPVAAAVVITVAAVQADIELILALQFPLRVKLQ